LAEKINDKIELLRELRNSFLKKDILESNVEDEAKFYNLVILLASQAGNLVNRHELSNTLNMADKTVERYLFILQKCFHIALISPYTENKRKEISQMPKVYFNDCGLRNSMINNFLPINDRLDKGALLENFIFQHLRTKYEPEQLHFWRTADGNEVDFVLQDTVNSGIALEAKWETKSFKASKYKKFKENYPNFPLHVVGMDAETPASWVLKNIPISSDSK
jgi:predicted AAA+ superfamily ATPase